MKSGFKRCLARSLAQGSGSGKLFPLCIALLILTQACFAAPLRVTTWNLGELPVSATNTPAQKSAETRIQDAAVALDRLDPDVIILNQVRDWSMCQQVVQALRPADYSVQVCSSFRDAHTGAAGRQQIAILSKHKAYFSWSEPWRAEGQPLAGGFAFAAVRVGKQRVGLFAVQLGDGTTAATNGQEPAVAKARAACLQQWQRQVGSFKQWVTNRIEAVVIAGGFNELPTGGAAPPHSSEEINFLETVLTAPLENPTTLPKPDAASGGTNYVFAQLNPDADSLTGVVLDRCPATCDLDLTPGNQTIVPVARNKAAPPKAELVQAPAGDTKPRSDEVTTPAPAVAQSVLATPSSSPGVRTGQAVPAWKTYWPIGLAAGILVFVVAWALGRRKQTAPPRAQTLIALGTDGGGRGSTSDAVVITSQSITGSATDPVRGSPIIHIESSGSGQSETEQWRRRALAAEERAERTAAAVRQGLMPQMRRWLKQKLVRKLISDRTELLETQHAAALKAMAVDERLSRIELQIQQQNAAYERRIEELMRELAAAKEENRELIRAKIAQVKSEMEAARVKALQQAKE